MRYLSKPYVQVVPREDWGAAAPRKPPEPLTIPVAMLMFFDTQTEECKTTVECKRIVKGLQDEYMINRGYEDIPWNFLIGADGKIYEGRGWKVKPFKTNIENPTQAEWDGRSVDVAYIGDYRNDLDENPVGKYPSVRALNTVEKLSEHLIKKKIISYQITGYIDFTIDLEAMQID